MGMKEAKLNIQSIKYEPRAGLAYHLIGESASSVALHKK